MDVKVMVAGTLTSAMTVTGSKTTISGGLKMSSGSVTQTTSLQVSHSGATSGGTFFIF